jgi:hypothetical protein
MFPFPLSPAKCVTDYFDIKGWGCKQWSNDASKFPASMAMRIEFAVQIRVVDPDPEPDPYWIRIQSGLWIRIRIRNPDPDPGGLKRAQK